MLKNNLSIFFAFTAALAIFAGCSSGSNDPGTPLVDAPFAVLPENTAVAVNKTIRFVASGGHSPYVFKLREGKGDLVSSRDGVSASYLAPSIPGLAEIQVTDSSGAVRSLGVDISALPMISPSMKSIAAGNKFPFSTIGGKGPYQFSIVSGNATIDPSTGYLTAPSSGGSAIVRVSDNIGSISDAEVTIQDSLSLSASVSKVSYGGSVTFSTVHGIPPYSYSVVAGGGEINAETGIYTAPEENGPVVVRVMDSEGNSDFEFLTIESPSASNVSKLLESFENKIKSLDRAVSGKTTALSLSPVILAIKNTQDFASKAVGGVPPYTFTAALSQGVFDGSVYTAPSASGVYTVTVKDSQSPIPNSATANVTVNAALTFLPEAITVMNGGTAYIAPAGGVPPYSYEIASGIGTIAPVSGSSTPAAIYTAPATAGSANVRVKDSYGNSATAIVTIAESLAISPSTLTVITGSSTQFSGSGGVPPYKYVLVSGDGTIHSSTGIYLAGRAGTANVQIIDAAGNKSPYASLQVFAPLSISPNKSTPLTLGSKIKFDGINGSGIYQYSMVGDGTLAILTTTTTTGTKVSGEYTAPSVAGKKAIITVTDTVGQSKSITVYTYGQMTFLTAVIKSMSVGEQYTFGVSGTANPIRFSVTNSDVGTIDSAKGVLTALKVGTTDVIATDTVTLETITANVTVFLKPEIIPISKTLAVNNKFVWSGENGVPPYTFTVPLANPSQGMFTGSTYTAPKVAGGPYVVTMKDLNAIQSLGSVTIVDQIAVTPLTAELQAGGTQVFNTTGGVPPITFSVISGGGSFDGGTYTGPNISSGGAAVVRATDSLGNNADATVTIPALLVSISSPNSADFVNKGNVNDFAVSGTCSEARKFVNVVVNDKNAKQVSGAALCPDGASITSPKTWAIASPGLNLSSLAEGMLQVKASHSNTYGVQAVEALVELMNDATTPTVTISSPLEGKSFASLIHVTGDCSVSGRPVQLSFKGYSDISAVTTCSSGHSYSANLAFSSSVTDGDVTITANHSSFGGNAATEATLRVIRDTLAPTSPSITINHGDLYTRDSQVNLTLSAVGANEMYITNQAGCPVSDPAARWVSYSSDVIEGWVLGQSNTTTKVYVKFRDEALNESECVEDSITHDNLAPSLPTLSVADANPSPNSNRTPTIVISNLTSNDAISLYSVEGCLGDSLASGVATGATLVLVTSSLSKDQIYHFYAKATDPVGNSICSSSHADYELDTTPPLSPKISITSGVSLDGELYTGTMKVNLSLSAAEAKEMYISNTSDCSGATDTAWIAYSEKVVDWTLAEKDVKNTVSVLFRDRVKNESACVSTQVTHDGLAPENPVLALASSMKSPGKSRTPLITVSNIHQYDQVSLYRNKMCEGAPDSSVVSSGGSTDLVSGYLPNDQIYQFYAKVVDPVGNATCSGDGATVSYKLDTVSPTSPTIVVTSGTLLKGVTYTKTMSVDLSFSANGDDVNQVFITNTAGCQGSGEWINYTGKPTTFKGWLLGQSNQLTKIYAKFRDLAENESDCVFAEVEHDNEAPIAPSLVQVTQPTSTPTKVQRPTIRLSGLHVDDKISIHADDSRCDLASLMGSGLANAESLDLTLTSAIAEGKHDLYTRLEDPSGNSACYKSVTGYEVDLTPPALVITVPNPNLPAVHGNSIVSSNKNVFVVSGDCTETGSVITVRAPGNISKTTNCSSARIWSVELNVESLDDGQVLITADSVDLAGNDGAQVSVLVSKDTTGPGPIALTLENLGINKKNEIAFPISGTCSNEGTRNVKILAAGVVVDKPLDCRKDGKFSGSLNFSKIDNADVLTLVAQISDVYGITKSSDPVDVFKDTIAPTNPTIVINHGDIGTNDKNVTLTLAAGGNPTSIYVTNTVGCALGGNWEDFSPDHPDRNWVLRRENATEPVFVMFMDRAGNRTACVKDTIIHDTIPPAAPRSFDDGTTGTLAATPRAKWVASFDSGSGLLGYEVAVGTTPGATNVVNWTKVSKVLTAEFTGMTLLSLGQQYFSSVRAVDNAGNVSVDSRGDGWIVRIVCPENFVLVPQLPGYSGEEFCVGKYEAKNVSTTAVLGTKAVTRSSQAPWVNLTLQAAQTACQENGSGYDLINNAEWQTIARNIELVAKNWSGGSVGSGSINRGHSDGLPNNSLIASPTDSNGCINTGQICSVNANNETSWATQRRVHHFSNEGVIWDFAGNVAEYVKDTENCSFLGDDQFLSQIGITTHPGQCSVGSLNADMKSLFGPAYNYSHLNSDEYAGFGYLYTSKSGLKSIVRGGSWNRQNPSGIFYTDLRNNSTEVAGNNVGFRCVYHPPKMGSTSIVINQGDEYTNQEDVVLTLIAPPSVKDMLITNVEGCGTGGDWEAYSATKSWKLHPDQRNMVATVFGKFKTAEGNETACLKGKIIHDDIKPAAPSGFAMVTPIINLANNVTPKVRIDGVSFGDLVSLHTDETCSEVSYRASGNAGGSMIYLTSSALSPDGSFHYYAKTRDSAGNWSDCSSTAVALEYTLDTTAPVTPSVTINDGAKDTASTQVTLKIASFESDSDEMYITNTAACTGGGKWEKYSATKTWELAEKGTPAPVYLESKVYSKFRDKLGNESACNFSSIFYDTTPPLDPSVFAMESPSKDLGNDTTPTVRLEGVELDSTIDLYTDQSCLSTAKKASSLASESSLLLTSSELNEGDHTFYLKLTDHLGNSRCSTTKTLVYHLDLTAPKITITGPKISNSPDIALWITQANVHNYPVSGTCDENGGTVILTAPAGATQSKVCENKSWSAEIDLSEISSEVTEATITANYADLAGNAAQSVQVTESMDVIEPAFANLDAKFAEIPIDKWIYDDFTLTGDCAEDGNGNVSVHVGTPASELFDVNVNCKNHRFTIEHLNFDGVDDGDVNLYVKHTDRALNVKTADAFVMKKDTDPPKNLSLAINEGKSATKSLHVELTLSAFDADQMYITNTPNCASGGSWEQYGTSKEWDLDSASVNKSNIAVWVKFRDLARSESECIADTIDHDDQAPAAPSNVTRTFPAVAAGKEASPKFLVDGVTKGDQISLHTVAGCTDSEKASLTAKASSITLTSAALTEDDTYTFYAKATDLAGNVTCSTASATYLFDHTPPKHPTFVINHGDAKTNVTGATLSVGSFESDDDMMYITDVDGCASGGVWENYKADKIWELKPVGDEAKVYAKFQDKYGNESTCINSKIGYDITPPSAPSVAQLLDPEKSPSRKLTPKIHVEGVTEGDTISLYTNDKCLNEAPKASAVAQGTSVDLTSSELAEGKYDLYVKLADPLGNYLCYPSAISYTVDLTSPLITMTKARPVQGSSDPGAVDWVLLSNQTQYLVAGTCNEDGGSLTLSATSSTGAASQETTTCTDGKWSTSIDVKVAVKSVSDIVLAANYTDIAGNAASPVSKNVTIDQTPPELITIDDSMNGFYINSSNVRAIFISGDCSEKEGKVLISVAWGTEKLDMIPNDKKDLRCSDNNRFTGEYSFVDVNNGNEEINITATHYDELDNEVVSEAVMVSKDTDPPTAGTITIVTKNGSSVATKYPTVNLEFSATEEPYEMYITNTPGCETGGTWERYNSPKKDWPLRVADTTTVVSAIFRDESGNKSECISASINYDTTPPSQPTNLTKVNPIGSPDKEKQPTIRVSGVRNHDTVSLHTLAGCTSKLDIKAEGTVSKDTDTSIDLKLDSDLSPDGSYTFYANVVDEAGNETCSTENYTYVLDTTAPNLPTLSFKPGTTIKNDGKLTTSDLVTLAISSLESPTDEMLILQETSEGCEAWTDEDMWEPYSANKNVKLNKLNELNTISIKVRDALKNVSEKCISIVIEHDNTPPSEPTEIKLTTRGYESESGAWLSNVTKPEFEIDGSYIKDDQISMHFPVLADGTDASQFCKDTNKVAQVTATGSSSLSLKLTNALGEGTYHPYLKLIDPYGNTTCVDSKKSYQVDFTAPVVTITIPNPVDPMDVTQWVRGTEEQMAHYAVKGTCNETGGTVVVTGSGGARSEVVCNVVQESSQGEWSAELDLNAALNGPSAVKISVNYKDLAENSSAEVSVNVTKDTLPPDSITLSTVDGNSKISQSNWKSFPISVACSEKGTKNVAIYVQDKNVDLEPSQIGESLDCPEAETFQTNLNLEHYTLATGALTFTAKHNDLAANVKDSAELNVNMDVISPADPTISINDGGIGTKVHEVELSLLASGEPTEMYITNTAECNSGGTWETYTAPTMEGDKVKKKWNLLADLDNAVGTVYVKYRDSYLNESTCVNDTIIHDTVDPTALTSVDDGRLGTITASARASWTDPADSKALDSGSGVGSYEVAIGTTAGATDVSTWQDVGKVAFADISELKLITLGSKYYTSVRVVDNAGNKSEGTVGDGWIARVSCPDGYVPVPPLPGYTNEEFCVSKYEAKDTDGNPLSKITASEAKDKCQNLGTEYQLISNAEWQTIARNIVSKKENWIDPTLSAIPNGLRRGFLGGRLVDAIKAGSDDTDGCSGTGLNCTSSDNYAEGPRTNRTHTLSNGEVIWDFAGNVGEYVLESESFSCTNVPSGVYQASGDSFVGSCEIGALRGPISEVFGYFSGSTPSLSLSHLLNDQNQFAGLGGFKVTNKDYTDRERSVNSTTSVLVRGGDRTDGLDAGVFGVKFYDITNTSYSSLTGFRCAFHPDTSSAPSFMINNGAIATNKTEVDLSFRAPVDVTKVYITNEEGCSTDGNWADFSASKKWTLKQRNALATVYAKFKNGDGNESACLSASINHDDQAPDAPTALALVHPSSPGNVKTPTIRVSGVHNYDQVKLYLNPGCKDLNLKATSISSGETIDIQSGELIDSNKLYKFYAKTTDSAGNVSPCSVVNASYWLDFTPPPVSTVTINDGDTIAGSTDVLLKISQLESTTDEMFITNDPECKEQDADGKPTGEWESYQSSKNWTLAVANEVTTIYSKYRDALGNTSACVAAKNSITADTLPPDAPSLVELFNPITTPSRNLLPTIRVSGVHADDAISIHKESTCKSELAIGKATKDEIELPFTVRLDEGKYGFYVKLEDPLGNARCYPNAGEDVIEPLAYEVDLTPPVVAIQSPTLADNLDPTKWVISANYESFPVSGTCEDSNGIVTISATNTPAKETRCTADSEGKKVWTDTLNLMNALDGDSTVVITVDHTDFAGNRSLATNRTISKDTVAPEYVSIDASVAQTKVAFNNMGHIAITGSCAEPGVGRVQILVDGVETGSRLECRGDKKFGGGEGEFFDFSKKDNPAIVVAAVHYDAAGNHRQSPDVTMMKDSVKPSSPSIVINGGAEWTNLTRVSLRLSATDTPTEVMITTTSGCESGTWIDYVTNSDDGLAMVYAWDLGIENDKNTLYAKFRDSFQNESECTSDDIKHDNIAPDLTKSLLTLVDLESRANNRTPTVRVTSVEKDDTISIHADDKYCTSITQKASGVVQAGMNEVIDLKFDSNVSLALADGQHTFYAKSTDQAGNFTCANATVDYFLDTLSPVPVDIAFKPHAVYTTSKTVTLQIPLLENVDDQMYITNEEGCSTGGSWEDYVAEKSWLLKDGADGLRQVYAKFRDFAGNESSCVSPLSASITLDMTAPVFSKLDRVMPLTARDKNATPTLRVNGVLEAGDIVSLHTDKDCTIEQKKVETKIENDMASVELTTSALAEGSYDFYIKMMDSIGNQKCYDAALDYFVDLTPPTIAITAPDSVVDGAEISPIYSGNQDKFTVDGTCSESDGTVVLNATGGATASKKCESGEWHAEIDLTSAPERPDKVTITADYTDIAGNSATQISVVLNKDTIAPTGVAMKIDGGAEFTTKENVTLTIPELEPNAKMYITNDSSCESGGDWIDHVATKSWTLGETNKLTRVYIKLRDATGNETSCLDPLGSASITHDNTPPAEPTELAVVNPVLSSPTASTKVKTPTIKVTGALVAGDHVSIHANDATCSLLTQKATVSIEADAQDVELTTSELDSDAWSNVTYEFYARMEDHLGNFRCSETKVTYILDLIPPAITIYQPSKMTPDEPESWINPRNYQHFEVSGICSDEGTTIEVSATGGATASDICDENGEWGVFLDLTDAPEGVSSVSFDIISRDTAGNERYDLIVQSKDTISPGLISIDVEISQVDINHQLEGAYTISGKCSEVGTENVTIYSGTTALAPKVSCTGTDFFGSFSFEGIPDGDLSLTAHISDFVGNKTVSAPVSVRKDVTPPTLPAIMINGGDEGTSSNVMNLSLLAFDSPTEMYVTDLPGCGVGGTWEKYDTSKTWTIESMFENSLVTLYVKYRDVSKNETECVSDFIIHDTVGPTIPTAFDDGVDSLGKLRMTSPMSWTASMDYGVGVDSYEVTIGTTAGGTDIKDWMNVGDVTSAEVSEVMLIPGVTYYSSIRAKDKLGQLSEVVQGDGWVANTFFSCPSGYIFVPSLGTTEDEDFCVAKYEAKQVLTAAHSTASGTPWVSISQADAITACQNNGQGFDLLNNAQWQILARDIENASVNWSSSTRGSGSINRGHSDSVPNEALAAGANDQLACEGTGESCSDINWHQQRRTHVLATGDIIWDLAGNVSEWMKDTNTNMSLFGGDAFLSQVTTTSHTQFGSMGMYEGIAKALFGPLGDYASLNSGEYGGFGYANFSSNAGGVVRGGTWVDNSHSGVFATRLDLETSASDSHIGFRCIYQGPQPPSSFVDGDTSGSASSPMMSWVAPAGVPNATYEIAIGSGVGKVDVVPWTDIGSVLQYQFNDLSLSPGGIYYGKVRVKDSVGNTSTIVEGDGWTVE